MTIAFGNFDEPLAWLIRGLIEYGWIDITRQKTLPNHALGGFDLSFIPESQARSGVILRVPAVAGHQRCTADESYAFEVKLIQMNEGTGFAVRSDACNYLQEFPFDPNNPVWAAGYIHHGLGEYIAEFVRWRLGGGELTWAQRQGVPGVDGGPCSASFASWIEQQLTLHRHFDASLWGQGYQSPTSSAQATPSTPVVSVGNYGKTPAGSSSTQDLLQAPSKALFIMVSLGLTAATLALLNVFITIALFGFSRPFALLTNMALIAWAGGGGAAAWYGWREYRSARGTILPWVAIVYPSLIPLCCFAGIPISIWAARQWQSPSVVQRRQINRR